MSQTSKAREEAKERIAQLIARQKELRDSRSLYREDISSEKEIENDLIRFRTDGNFEAIKTHLFSPSQHEKMETKENISLSSGKRESAKVDVILNEDQEKASALALTKKSHVVIGAAGTGKTTGERIIIQRERDAGFIYPFPFSTKYLREGMPAIVVVSYTNKAVTNIRRGMPKDVTCVTGHKLIEFEPVFYEIENAEGVLVKTMRFQPNRDRYNKLPPIALLVFEESSTISTILHQQIMDALSNKPQIIYMGDIQQLPPIYGPAILGFKMLELPVVELKTVMRQALDSNVLSFAWDILNGQPMSIKYISSKYDKDGEFKIRPWKKRLTSHDAMHVASLLMNQFIDSKEYNPLEDMILIPFARNTSKENFFCTNELNLSIAQKLGKDRGAIVHEIIAGFQKMYFAIGDKLLVNKQECLVTKISINADYAGRAPLEPSAKMNRHGQYEFASKEEAISLLSQSGTTLEDVEQMMLAASMDSGEIEDRKNQASHVLHCKMLDSEDEVDIRTSGEYAETSFAYALTVHKAQGSEWKRVILLLHHSHNKMISRELLYTAVTRARESLYIICEPEHFEKGVLRQRIKGNTLEEKAEFFKGKLEDIENGEMK